MYVCMYVCRYACMHVCMYACRHVGMYPCMHVCMHVCMYAWMHGCMDACMHGCMDGWMDVCMFLVRSLSEVWSWGVPLPHWSQNAHRPPEISIELSVRCTGSWLMMVHFTCRLRACHEAMLQAGSQRESPCWLAIGYDSLIILDHSWFLLIIDYYFMERPVVSGEFQAFGVDIQWKKSHTHNNSLHMYSQPVRSDCWLPHVPSQNHVFGTTLCSVSLPLTINPD